MILGITNADKNLLTRKGSLWRIQRGMTAIHHNVVFKKSSALAILEDKGMHSIATTLPPRRRDSNRSCKTRTPHRARFIDAHTRVYRRKS